MKFELKESKPELPLGWHKCYFNGCEREVTSKKGETFVILEFVVSTDNGESVVTDVFAHSSTMREMAATFGITNGVFDTDNIKNKVFYGRVSKNPKGENTLFSSAKNAVGGYLPTMSLTAPVLEVQPGEISEEGSDEDVPF